MADYGLEPFVYEMNKTAAEIAVRAARAFTARTPDKPRFVIGCMGPTNRTASLSPDVDNPAFRAIGFDGLMEAYYEEARGLLSPRPVRPLAHLLMGAMAEAAMVIANAADPAAAREEVEPPLLALLAGLRQ